MTETKSGSQARPSIQKKDAGKMTAVEKLRAMLADPEKFIACPGVYDGFTARIALQEGVDCLYMVRHVKLEARYPSGLLVLFVHVRHVAMSP